MLLLCVIAGCNDKDVLNSEMIPVRSGSKYGYVDKEGNYLINPQFDRAAFFRSGLALVMSNGLCGYVDTKGNYIIPPAYMDITTFAEGVAWAVKKDGPPTAINKKGEVLFALKEADRVYNFSEGMARYRIVSPYNENEYLYGFINKKGETVIQPVYSDASDFAEGVAAVANENKEYGYINKKGELVINYQFNRASSFYKGRAVISSNYVYGTVDKAGKYIINPQFGYMVQDGDNYIIQLQDGRQWGWCDAKGKIIVNPQFDAVDKFTENDLAPVRIGEKVGFINRKGAITINPQFDSSSSFFDNSYAVVEVNDKYGAVDKDGKYIFNPQFDDLGPWENISVFSQYFNVEAITAIVQVLISNSKIDGKIDFTTPLSRIMSQYGLTEDNISKNRDIHKLNELLVSKDATITLAVVGKFYNKVSDGWWGYNYVLDRNAIPAKYQITIDLKNRGDGKSEKLRQAIFNHFKKQVSGRVDEHSWEMDYGICQLKIDEKWNKLIITCSNHR